jgi:hypothetical protein
MIAADILSKDAPETRDSAGLFFNVDDAEAHDCFVTYDVFANQYWPHFPQNLTKNLSSVLFPCYDNKILTLSHQTRGWFSANLWVSNLYYLDSHSS